MRVIDMFPAGSHRLACDPRVTRPISPVIKKDSPELDAELALGHADGVKVKDRKKVKLADFTTPPCVRCARAKLNTKCEQPHRPHRSPDGDPKKGVLLVVLNAFADGVRYVTEVLRGQGWEGMIYFDLPVRCGGGKKKVAGEQVDACRPYLAFNMGVIKPTHILTCGTMASRAVLGTTVMVYATRGTWQVAEFMGRQLPVVATCSTVDASTNRFYDEAFRREVAILISTPWELVPYPAGRAIVVEDHHDLPAFREWVADAPYLAFDTETRGIQFRRDFRILSIAFSKPGTDDVFVFYESMANPVCREAIKWALREKPLWGSNVNYDVRSVWCDLGIDISLNVAQDVRLLYKGFWAGFPADLEEMAGTVGIGQHKAEATAALKQAKKELRAEWDDLDEEMPKDRIMAYAYEKLTSPIHERYVARDTLSTRLLGEALLAQAAEHEFVGKHHDEVVMPACRRMFRIERRGMLVDLVQLRALRIEVEAKMAELTLSLTMQGINPDSPDSVRQFFEREGIRIKRLTKASRQAADERGYVDEAVDKMSTDKRALLQAKQIVSLLHPEMTAIAEMIEHRKVSKLHSANIKTIQRYIGDDGRVHPSFLLGAAASGRSSVKDPAAHSVPGRTPEGKAFKSCFVAAPGYEILVADYCLAAGTPVLKSDLSWVSIESLREGDELVGFDEDPEDKRKRCFRPSIVEKTKTLHKSCVRVVTDECEVTASADHMWLVKVQGGNGARWVRSAALRARDEILYIGKPWEPDTTYAGGYMAGLLDGEGCVHGRRVGFAQNRCPVLDKFVDLTQKAGFATTPYARAPSTAPGGNCLVTHMNKGGPFSAMRALGVYRPLRLLPKARSIWDGMRCWGQKTKPAVVQSVTQVGVQTVYAVQTSTRTFIANGLFSHNCTLEVFGAAFAANDPVMLGVLEPEDADFHLSTAMKIAPIAWGLTGEEVARRNKEAKAAGKKCKERDQAKMVGLATMYGIGPEALAEGLGTTRAEAGVLIDAFRTIYPTYRKWVLAQEEFVRRNGYTVAHWGGRKSRFRWLYDAGYHDMKRKSHALRAGSNHPIQSECSDYCLASGVIIEEKLEEFGDPMTGVIMEVHDSIVLEVREDLLIPVARIVKDVMTSWPAGPFPLRVSMEVGPSWGEAKDWSLPEEVVT